MTRTLAAILTAALLAAALAGAPMARATRREDELETATLTEKE